MPVAVGTVLNNYELTGLLGQGGMGTVYRARDLKLKREVAIKILPDEFASDPDRLGRFQHEAEALAALTHANIAAIHDLQEAEDTTFLVLELVEGETLDELIAGARGPLPIDTTLSIAQQICSALEAAHDKGIVHRDLKPANIKIAPDGAVKLLDFGVASMLDTGSPSTLADTVTRGGTSLVDLVVGTPSYMAPEQARGQPIDARADIWAFGCVLYQLLTGVKPFKGETIAATVGLVLAAEPDWTILPPSTSLAIRALLRQCLKKDRKHRLSHIADARIWIEDVLANPAAEGDAPIAAAAHPKWMWAGWGVAAVAAVTLAGAVWQAASRPGPPQLSVHVNTQPTSDPAALAISADGRRIVFPVASRGTTTLFVRPLDALTSEPVPGTDGASFPFWSPTGASVAFFADGQLKRVDIGGGVPVVLGKAPLGRGGTWSDDGTIVYAPTGTGPLYRISASGGESEAVTEIESGQMSHRFPKFLPDGRHFLFFAAGTSPGLYVGSLDGGALKRVLSTEAAGTVTPSGFVFFLRQGALFAQRFDFAAHELRDQPVPVAEQVAVDSGAFLGGFTAASNVVAYRTGGAGGRRQLTWFTREGKAIASVGEPETSALTGVELSPDGRQVAANRLLNGNLDIWLIDVIKGALTRLSFDAALDAWPHWSADGTHILFSSNAKGTYDLYEKPSGSAQGDRLVFASDQAKIPQDVSPDGREILFASLDPVTGFDLLTVPIAGGQEARVFRKTPFQESGAQYSPDGRWIAYHSNESGRYEVYVQPADGRDSRIQVSTGGGAQPRWRRDGRELFYVSLDSNMTAAPVTPAPAGGQVDIGAAAPLFGVTIVGGPVLLNNTQQYAASPDGQRFLINVAIDPTPPINLLYNWRPPATP